MFVLQSNSRPKRGYDQSDGSRAPKRTRETPVAQDPYMAQGGYGGYAPPSGADPWAAYGAYGMPQQMMMQQQAMMQQPMPGMPAAAPGSSCTLFVAGLGPSATEEELRAAFGSLGGLKNIKMKGGNGRPPVAWVQYENHQLSGQAMATFNGTMLNSSDRGAIRIEFAKSEMGR